MSIFMVIMTTRRKTDIHRLFETSTPSLRFDSISQSKATKPAQIPRAWKETLPFMTGNVKWEEAQIQEEGNGLGHWTIQWTIGQFIYQSIVALLWISINCSFWRLSVLSVPVSYWSVVFFFMCLATTDSVMVTALERNVFGVFLKPGVNLPSVFASVRRLGTPPFGDRRTPRSLPDIPDPAQMVHRGHACKTHEDWSVELTSQEC